MTFQIEFRGIRPLHNKLINIESSIRSPIIANAQVSQWLVRWVNDNFKTEGGKVGKWAPFKLGGRKVKKGKWGKRSRYSGKNKWVLDTSAKLLQDTGQLRGSFKGFATNEVAGVGTEVTYSKYHEYGVPKNKLPQRRMMPDPELDKDVVTGVLKIYQSYFKTELSK